MDRFIVIELLDNDNYVWAYELTREFTAEEGDRGVAYHRNPRHRPLFFGEPDARLYGKLDALLVTRRKLDAAQPITPIAPPPAGVIAEQLAAVDRATKTAYNDPQPEGLDMVPERVEEWIAAPTADEDGQ